MDGMCFPASKVWVPQKPSHRAIPRSPYKKPAILDRDLLRDSCDWSDPVPWQRLMLRSRFDRRPATPCRESRPMECKELEIQNCAQAIPTRAGKLASSCYSQYEWAAGENGSGRAVVSDAVDAGGFLTLLMSNVKHSFTKPFDWRG